jgi:hypothetical protein
MIKRKSPGMPSNTENVTIRVPESDPWDRNEEQNIGTLGKPPIDDLKKSFDQEEPGLESGRSGIVSKRQEVVSRPNESVTPNAVGNVEEVIPVE